jgi:F-type H+-transporting ATPase subunit b
MHHGLLHGLPLGGGLFLGGAIIDLDGTFFLQLGIFVVLFLFLREVVFKPVVAVLDAREHATDGAKDEARELEARAKEKLAAFEAEMTKAKVELSSERERLRKDGAALERELLSKARSDADKILEDANEKMAEETAIARRHIDETVPQFARDIADKLLGRKAG